MKILEFNELANELEAIRATAQLYIEGVKSVDSSKIEKAFHADLIMSGFYEDGEYHKFDRAGFLQHIDGRRDSGIENLCYDGSVVDIYHHRKTAVVKIRIENERVVFTDYLSLLNLEGEWKIIHKIWDTELKTS